jgi:hypothetical protein
MLGGLSVPDKSGSGVRCGRFYVFTIKQSIYIQVGTHLTKVDIFIGNFSINIAINAAAYLTLQVTIFGNSQS